MSLVHPQHPYSTTANVGLLGGSSFSVSLLPPPTPPKDTKFLSSHLPIFLTMSSSVQQALSDEELDKAWQDRQGNISPRPQSTMARSFSLALNDLFKIDGSLADLDAAVDQKKKAVSSQTSELEALEARLRATEERLKAVASSPNRSGRSSPRPRPLLGDTFSPPKEPQGSPLATEMRPGSAARPQTKEGEGIQGSFQASIPGALPPTPSASEDGDFVSANTR